MGKMNEKGISTALIIVLTVIVGLLVFWGRPVLDSSVSIVVKTDFERLPSVQNVPEEVSDAAIEELDALIGSVDDEVVGEDLSDLNF